MFESFKKKDSSEPSRFSAVIAATREALRPIEEKKRIGKLALLRRKRADMQRLKGLGSSFGVEERLFRADFDNALLKSGVHIMIDALQAEIEAHEKATADFAEVVKANEQENEKLSAEIAELTRKRDQLHRDAVSARTRCVWGPSRIAERHRELEGYLELAEAISRGENLKLWKPLESGRQLQRQPLREVDLEDLPEYTKGSMTLPKAEKRVAEINLEYRVREQHEWDEASRAFELQVPVADLRLLESNDREAA